MWQQLPTFKSHIFERKELYSKIKLSYLKYFDNSDSQSLRIKIKSNMIKQLQKLNVFFTGWPTKYLFHTFVHFQPQSAVSLQINCLHAMRMRMVQRPPQFPCLKVQYHLSSNSQTEKSKSSFADFFTGNNLYVDKTLFIKRFLELPKVLMILFPKNWGKSRMMSMLQAYYEITTDAGQKISIQQLFFENKIALKISSDTKFKKQHFQKYPCISLDFAIDLSRAENSLDDHLNKMKQQFVKVIFKEYQRHSYLASSKDLSIQKEFACFSQLLQNGYLDNQMTNLEGSIRKLSALLFREHNKKVMIFIDDYDCCLNSISTLWKNPLHVKDMSNFIRKLFTAIVKSKQQCVEKVMFSGVLPLQQSLFLQEINSLAIYNTKSTQLINFYGITIDEVKQVLMDTKYTNNTQLLTKIKKFYGGYSTSNADESNLRRFNSISVVSFLLLIKNIIDRNQINPYFDRKFIQNYFFERRVYEIISKVSNQITANPLEQISARSLQIINHLKNQNFSDFLGENLVFSKAETINSLFKYLESHGFFIYVNGFYRIPNIQNKRELVLIIRNLLNLKNSMEELQKQIYWMNYTLNACQLVYLIHAWQGGKTRIEEFQEQISSKLSEIVEKCNFVDLQDIQVQTTSQKSTEDQAYLFKQKKVSNLFFNQIFHAILYYQLSGTEQQIQIEKIDHEKNKFTTNQKIIPSIWISRKILGVYVFLEFNCSEDKKMKNIIYEGQEKVKELELNFKYKKGFVIGININKDLSFTVKFEDLTFRIK